ncbi:unnamed protein product [Toxocara canis]|uniref:SDR family NAD(P)-dependent oxidoreductase n=1 Tax=Toxocara canis TaxID=6265 RepID=A0A183UWP9_TOXCA|nr:unnamed protein product [Toxocara canis]
MVERDAGIIVNIASAAAYNQMQMWAAYCAAKKYVIRLSNVMRREYSRTNLVIQCLCPMVVTTKMSKVEGMRVMPRFMTYAIVDRRTRSLNRKALAKKENKQ